MKYFVVFLCIIVGSYCFVCVKDYCSTVKCENIKSCPPNHVLKDGGFCNCCSACYKVQGLNEPCPSTILGTPETVICDEGLFCNNGTCQNVSVLEKLISNE